MSHRKAVRRSNHWRRRGFMVVHPRWLDTSAACWQAWLERRNG